MELQQVNENGKWIHSCRGTHCSESSRTTGSWWMLEHSSLTTQQVLQAKHSNASLWALEAFFSQHNPSSVSLFYSLYFPWSIRTDWVTFWLEEISCSRQFSCSVPPIHFTKSPEGYNPFPSLFSPRKHENRKWQNASCLISSPLVQSSTAKMPPEPKAWVWLNFKQAKHQLFWFIDPGEQDNCNRLK